MFLESQVFELHYFLKKTPNKKQKTKLNESVNISIELDCHPSDC